MTTPFLLYGSYGYTGSLIVELAVKRGMQPILSGRDVMRSKNASRFTWDGIPPNFFG